MDKIEVRRATNTYSHHWLDTLSPRLGDQCGVGTPTLEVLTSLGLKTRGEVSKDRLYFEPCGRIPAEVVNLLRRRTWPSHARMEKEIERFEDRALARIVWPKDYRASAGLERKSLDPAEPLNPDLPNVHDPILPRMRLAYPGFIWG
jgi:hypothetical protein